MLHSKRYSGRGVSSTKDEVHQAIKLLDKGLYPSAFCKILPDIAAGDKAFCNILHADTAGTKASLAYVYWKETGDLSVWHGIAQDAIVMNLDDMACVGCVDNLLLSNTITRNKHLIPGEVISGIIEGTIAFCDRMSDYGIHIHNAGGETADVGDIVRTVDIGFTAFGRMARNDLIVNDIRDGDVIVGLSSSGKAVYEDAFNSGIGSNGLTSARHDLFAHKYADMYPESFSPDTPEELVYAGDYAIDDPAELGGAQTTVGKMVLSPTRTYAPFIKFMLDRIDREQIHGLIHCTGGGQTKISKFLAPELCAVKDAMPAPPDIFRMIAETSGATFHEMYQVFNMGIRLEVYVPEPIARQVIDLAAELQIDACLTGRVTTDPDSSVVIEVEGQKLRYS